MRCPSSVQVCGTLYTDCTTVVDVRHDKSTSEETSTICGETTVTEDRLFSFGRARAKDTEGVEQSQHEEAEEEEGMSVVTRIYMLLGAFTFTSKKGGRRVGGQVLFVRSLPSPMGKKGKGEDHYDG